MKDLSYCNHHEKPVQDGVQCELPESHVVAHSKAKLRLDGHFARRVGLVSGIYWDTDLPGFGLRVRSTGSKAWIVKLRERGRQRFATLGVPGKLSAPAARELARRRLERSVLDGLPQRPKQASELSFAAYVERFWSEYTRLWKPTTIIRNRSLLNHHLLPRFGDMSLTAIYRSDVLRWRDDLIGQQGSFNRGLPLLAVMLGYAEKLGLRTAGSNPCKGTPRYKRALPNRYLSAAEYRRLALALDEADAAMPRAVAAIRLLMFTGARSSEITALHWTDIQPPRLTIRDSKTGPKIVWLNTPAIEVLARLPRDHPTLAFPNASGTKPLVLFNHWDTIRRRAVLPDVRLHDLRHSFASVAITDGVPLSTIGRLLGHALPETTARYAHLADEIVADAAQRVGGGLAAAIGVRS